MGFSDHMNTQVKKGAKIIAVDPSQQLIHASLQGGQTVPVSAYSFAPVFRWPKVGESWILREENGSWFLDSIREEQEASSGIEAQAGDAIISSSTGRILINQNGTLTDDLVQKIPNLKVAKSPSGSDDHAMLQAMVDSFDPAIGGTMLIPWPYLVSAPVLLPSNVDLIGLGVASRLTATGNNYCVGFQPGQGNHNKIGNFLLHAFEEQGAGGGIDYTNAVTDIRVFDIIVISNLYNVFNIAPSTYAVGIYWLDNIRFAGGVGITNAFFLGDGSNLVTDVNISNVIATSGTNEGVKRWFYVARLTDTLKVKDSTFFRGGLGVNLGTRGNPFATVTGSKWQNVVFDSCQVPVQIDAVHDFEWQQCNINGTVEMEEGAPGIDIFSNAKGVRLRGGMIQNCRRDGIDIRAGSEHVDIEQIHVTDCNQIGNPFGTGIAVASGASEFSIVHSRAGNWLNGSIEPNGLVHGIQVAPGPSDFYVIEGNRTPGCFGAPFEDNGTGVNKVVRDNI